MDLETKMLGERFGEGGSILIVKKLGEGGMGTVFLARDEKAERDVAMKFLRMDGLVDRETITRFKREGKKFALLRHPNIVRVYSLGRERGMIYICSEFVAGKNLYEALTADGVFPVEKALQVIRAAALALQHAHDNQVVHRDLKPENIMIRSNDGAVKLLDFGIAKDLDASIMITRQGSYIGTPAYSSPEQIRGEEVDGRSDIFSLGVILYELLTGRVAFEGRHTTDVLKATINDAPIPVTRWNESVITPVARLIEKMIEKRAGRRHSSMSEVVSAVDHLLGALSAGYTPEEAAGVAGRLKRFFEGLRPTR